MSGFHIIGLFLLLSFLGVPLAVSMGLSAITYMVIAGIPLATIAHRMGNALNSFPLLAIPLFILAAEFMNTGSIMDRLLHFCNAIVGRFRGGLGCELVAISPDGRTLIVLRGGKLSLWSVDLLQELFTFDLNPGSVVHGAAFSPDGRTVAGAGSANDKGEIYLWSIGPDGPSIAKPKD